MIPRIDHFLASLLRAKLNNLRRNKFIVVVLATFSCCGIIAVLSLMNPVSPEYTTTSETAADETQIMETEQESSDIEQFIEQVEVTGISVAVIESEISMLNHTPRPSHTPPEGKTIPDATHDPVIIRPGTYLVGGEIQPGIYRGEVGSSTLQSCYWARLQDLTGGPDSIVAEGNSVGPFIVEVLGSDFALSTACELQLIR